VVALGIVASRNGCSKNGRVRNGRSRIGCSRIGTSTEEKPCKMKPQLVIVLLQNDLSIPQVIAVPGPSSHFMLEF
jgi:hypothetical protein